MNRRKAATKMTNIVHAGWMTKSPPERKLRKHFKIFRSQWKKRYFVLRKPSGSLPDQYELYYYKDQRCNNKKGSIDLEQCEQIIEALDSDIFPYLLAIKTSYKNKVRTYFLATDTENDMNSWVRWLCHICGLRPEDQPTDIPDLKPDTATEAAELAGELPGKPNTVNGVSNSLQPQAKKATPTPLPTSPQPTSSQPTSPQTKDVHQESPPLLASTENRRTKQRWSVEDNIDVENRPDSDVPPLPLKRQANRNNGMLNNGTFTHKNVYDHPPLQHKHSGPYHVPPNVGTRDRKISSEDTDKISFTDAQSYQTHSPNTSLPSLPDSWNSDVITGQTNTSKDSYDYPHPDRGGLLISSDSEILPERPPKPFLPSPYQNLPPTERTVSVIDLTNTVPAPPKCNQSLHISGYDVPRLTSQRSVHTHQMELSLVPTVPRESSNLPSANFSSHTYLNTTNTPGSFEMLLENKSGGSYIKSFDYLDTAASPPAVPPPRTGFIGQRQDDRSVNSIYQHPPPSSASVVSSGSPTRPHVQTASQSPNASHNGNPTNSQVQDESTLGIFSTKRTRSFKSPHSLKNHSVKRSPKTNTVILSTTIPAPRPVLPPRPKEKSTSEDDEDLRAHEQEEETHHPMSLLRSVPAPDTCGNRNRLGAEVY